MISTSKRSSRSAMRRSFASNSGLTRVANCSVRPLRRRLRPSGVRCTFVVIPSPLLIGIGTGGLIGATSGAAKFMLASSSGGGAPSVRCRLMLLKSAIIANLVDHGLDEGVGFGIETGVAGFGNCVSGILGLAVRGPFQETAV